MLDSGPVTVIVYGFSPAMELPGTRGYMPFVTWRRFAERRKRSGIRRRNSNRTIQQVPPGVFFRHYNGSIPMRLRHATPDDIPAIVGLERMPMACEFVGQWSEDRHRAALAG